MACIKCGRDTENNQYFCAQCQETMQRYPVKPNIAIQLPKRQVVQETPKRRRRRLFPEETIEHLRSAVRWEAATIVVLLLALILVSGMLAWEWLQPEDYSIRDFGRNYTITSEESP